MSRKSDSHHVVPNSKGGWAVQRSGSDHASRCYQTKKEAIDAGRQISQNQKTEFFIHGRDGQIQRKDSHGGDPYPPRG